MSTAQPEPDIDVLPCGHPDDDPAVFHTDEHGDAVCSRCCPTCTPTGDPR